MWNTVFQVVNLGEEAPDRVLRRLFLNFERLKSNDDKIAAELEENLKIIVSCENKDYLEVYHSLSVLIDNPSM